MIRWNLQASRPVYDFVEVHEMNERRVRLFLIWVAEMSFDEISVKDSRKLERCFIGSGLIKYNEKK